VGRLVLHLHGVDDSASLRQSDAICTALQLINFWQDLGVDVTRGRLYIPEADCRRYAVAPAALHDEA
jgi:phytoene/squalene synthetase